MRLAHFAVLLLLIPASALADPPGAAERDAQNARRAAEQASRIVLTMLDQSRLDGDRRREQCFDGALTQIDSFSRMIEDRQRRLSEALARRDEREIVYHRAVIRRLVEQLRTVEHGAHRCLGPFPEED